MIRVGKIQDADTRGLYVMGHANADEHGKDIVCAAASMLFNTLVCRLEELRSAMNYQAESGDSFVICTGALTEAETQAFAFVECGFRALSEQYPDFVSLV